MDLGEVVRTVERVGSLDDAVLNPSTVLGCDCVRQFDLQMELSREAADPLDVRGLGDLEPSPRARLRMLLGQFAGETQLAVAPVGIPWTSSEPWKAHV
jgi:hypothetical protein